MKARTNLCQDKNNQSFQAVDRKQVRATFNVIIKTEIRVKNNYCVSDSSNAISG